MKLTGIVAVKHARKNEKTGYLEYSVLMIKSIISPHNCDISCGVFIIIIIIITIDISKTSINFSFIFLENTSHKF